MKRILCCYCCLLLTINFAFGQVNFKLKNNSPKSISLDIPGVMNPNLNPFSWSGVNLEVGQKIYHNGNLLLEVTKDLDGKKVNVTELIRRKKRELKKAS